MIWRIALINMYSVKGDVILDPFLGTGTTTAAAMTSGRNSIGVEIDESFQQVICPIAHHIVDFSNGYLSDRLQRHFAFVENRIQNSGAVKYTNKHYGCPVSDEPRAVYSLERLRSRSHTRR